jgi:hypothetical protein
MHWTYSGFSPHVSSVDEKNAPEELHTTETAAPAETVETADTTPSKRMSKAQQKFEARQAKAQFAADQRRLKAEATFLGSEQFRRGMALINRLWQLEAESKAQEMVIAGLKAELAQFKPSEAPSAAESVTKVAPEEPAPDA